MPSPYNYTDRGAPRMLVPGNMQASDYLNLNCIYRFNNPLYANANYNIGFFPAGSTVSVSIVQNYNGQTDSFAITIPASATTLTIPGIIQGYLPFGFTVNFNPALNAYVFTNARVGGDGAFSMNVNGTIVNATVGANPVPLDSGRILFPDTSPNVDVGAGLRRTENAYRYPAVGDSTSQIYSSVVTPHDCHMNYQNTLNLDTYRKVTAGTCFAGLLRGSIAVSFITPIATNTASLFLETSNAGNALAGRLTATPTGTTIAVPSGAYIVVSGTTAPNQIGVIRKLY